MAMVMGMCARFPVPTPAPGRISLPQKQSAVPQILAHTGRKTRKGAKIMKSIYSPAGFNIRRIRLRRKWRDNPPTTETASSPKSPPRPPRSKPDKSVEAAVATPEASPEATEAVEVASPSPVEA